MPKPSSTLQRGHEVPRPVKLHRGGGQIVEEASFTGTYVEPAIQLLEYDNHPGDKAKVSPSVPVPLAGILVGAAAMASSDAPAVKLGVTNLVEWGHIRLVDLVPHLAYGLVTAAVYEALARLPSTSRRRSRPRRGLVRIGRRRSSAPS